MTPRDRHDGTLPPGVAITTIEFPNFDKLAGHWVSEPVVRDGALYAGKRVGLIITGGNVDLDRLPWTKGA